MKTFHIRHIIGGLLLASTIALFSACSGTDDLTDTASGIKGLNVSLSIGDASVAASSRADIPSDANLNEDKIANLNVFVFDGTSFKKHYYFDSEHSNVGNGVKTQIEDASWGGIYTKDVTYHVYVVANYGSSMTATTIDALKAQTITTTDIYKSGSDRLFVMDGEYDWTAPASGSDVVIPVTVKRAASKIMLNLTFGTDFTTNYKEAGNWSWRLVNYGTQTTVIDNGNPVLDSNTKTTLGVVNSDESKTSVTGTFANGMNVVTYSYPNIWAQNSTTDQMMLEVNIPCQSKDGSTQYGSNVYFFPVTASSLTARNNIYTINATINNLGRSRETYNGKMNFTVCAWTILGVDINSTSGSKYLIVSPESIVLKNESDYNDIKYFSSSTIVTVKILEAYYRKADQSKQSLLDDDGNVLGYDPNATDNVVSITAAPKDASATNGTINFHSSVPENLGPRYITLQVTNADGISKTVNIVQYPLEYIVAIDGSYSYKDGWTSWPDFQSNWGGTWRADGDPFYSKYAYITTDWWGNTKCNIYTYGGSDTGGDNNHMYVVRITSTSLPTGTQYIIDKPKKDSNNVTDPSAANNNVVSPAFMLASQLGAVQSTDWTTAKNQCQKYIEVTTDGTVYDDWRLPTLAELEIISRYQGSGKGVMAEVLAGPYYWSAYHDNGQYGYYGTGKTGTLYGYTNGEEFTGKSGNQFTNSTLVSKGKYPVYIRCIRDLTPADITKLDAQIK